MTISQDTLSNLRIKAAELRRQIISMMGPNKAHHFGGSLSAADIITALYFYKLRYDPHNPDWLERDRFLMSKGSWFASGSAGVTKKPALPGW